MNALEKRIIDLSYRHKLTHISSCLNTVNLLAEIYRRRASDDPVCLDNSHAALALFVVLEAHGLCDAEEMIRKHGTHAGRDMEHGVWVSGGSLGQVATVAVGLALGYPARTVWLVTSDGACAEGAVHEALRISRQRCPNLKAFIVFNGLGAYGTAHVEDMPLGATIIRVNDNRFPDWMAGLAGHYLTLTEAQYLELTQ